MINIAICDDNRLDVEQIETALDTLNHYQISYDVYFSAEELLKYTSLNRKSYHLYILDIEMPDITGLELAKEMRKNGVKALFVFLTSYSQYAMEAFDDIMMVRWIINQVHIKTCHSRKTGKNYPECHGLP